MLCLYLAAPYGVFRNHTAGSFRPTATFITPSAAYGLLLNVAGIEMRREDPVAPMTVISPAGLPRFRLALGALEFPIIQSLYQQLHNYPVGNTGKDHAPNTKGNKYNITPVRRAFLSGIRAYICLDGNPDLERVVSEGLAGRSPRTYGVPFLGDNSFLVDRFEPIDRLSEAFWMVPVAAGNREHIDKRQVTRLTVRIDRADMSGTKSELFAPLKAASPDIPEAAWVEMGYG